MFFFCKSLFKLFAHEAEDKSYKVDAQFLHSLTCPERRGWNLPYQGQRRDPKAFYFLAKRNRDNLDDVGQKQGDMKSVASTLLTGTWF